MHDYRGRARVGPRELDDALRRRDDHVVGVLKVFPRRVTGPAVDDGDRPPDALGRIHQRTGVETGATDEQRGRRLDDFDQHAHAARRRGVGTSALCDSARTLGNVQHPGPAALAAKAFHIVDGLTFVARNQARSQTDGGRSLDPRIPSRPHSSAARAKRRCDCREGLVALGPQSLNQNANAAVASQSKSPKPVVRRHRIVRENRRPRRPR